MKPVGLHPTQDSVEEHPDRDLHKQGGFYHSDLAEQEVNVMLVHIQVQILGQLLRQVVEVFID
jgi:hypothetical protein